MKRGEVWWAQQPEPVGKRPVVLLSRDEPYKVRNAVTVAQKMCALAPEKIRQIDNALKFALD